MSYEIYKKDLIRLYFKEKKSFSQIAKIYKCHAQTICNRFKQYSLKARSYSDSLKGRKFTKEWLDKKSVAQTGKKLSKKTKSKIAEKAKGRKLSPETLAKISGKNHHCYGRRGSKHPMWKGGISKLNIRLRQTLKYKHWRESVFKRDNWTCQECFEKGGYKEVHHIISMQKLINEKNWKILWNIKNGITVCKKCHNKL